MILVVCLCLLFSPVSFSDGISAANRLSFSSVRLNPYTGTLLAEQGQQYRVYSPDGKTALSSGYPEASVREYGFFKVRMLNGVNDTGLLDGKGQLIIPTQYGEIEIISDRWQAGITLKPAAVDNFDYKDADSYYMIDKVDLFFQGKQVGTLDRLHWKNPYAFGDYLNVRNRDESSAWYNKDLQLSARGGQISEYTVNYGTGSIIHSGSGQKAFCAECTLQADEVINPYYFRKGDIVDLQGNVLCHLSDCDTVHYFFNGNRIGVVNRKKLYGYIDLTGKKVVPCEYESIDLYNNSQNIGYAYAVRDGKGGFVNLLTGEETGFEYSDKVIEKHIGFLTVENLDGSIIVICAGKGKLPAVYSSVTMCSASSSPSNPTAVLRDAEGRCGVINYRGDWLLPMSSDYEVVPDFYPGGSVSYDGTVVLTRKGTNPNGFYFEYSTYIIEQMPDPIDNRAEGNPSASANTAVMPDETPAPGKAPASAETTLPAEAAETWTCVNGHEGNTSKFCAECGAPKPTPSPSPAPSPAPTPAPMGTAETWICANGHEGNTSKFCAECGAPRPTPSPAPMEISETWTCVNGHEGNTSKFCAECGAPRPTPSPVPMETAETWTCKNGHEGNTSKFCAECGAPRQ